MTTLICDHKIERLPKRTSDTVPVLMYGLTDDTSNSIATIGHPIVNSIRQLGIQPSVKSIDFLSIALAVIAGDTFIQRKNTADGWTREISIRLSLCDPDSWESNKTLLENSLHFLSGDLWHFEFHNNGFMPPAPAKANQLERLLGLDCACLFSGGLDSAIGAIDLRANHKAPILVSHAYAGDATHQEDVASGLGWNAYRFSALADPHLNEGINEISMRTRSIGFLALGVIVTSILERVNHLEKPTLFIPENGFISLNVPLTPRRIGSLSTRTTHPYFIASIQELLNKVGINCTLVNPYQFMTKGEMISECKDRAVLKKVLDATVSCSHWKRRHIQCGVCIPCLIRRAASQQGNMIQEAGYLYQNLPSVLSSANARDDIVAMLSAISKVKNGNGVAMFANAGPLPIEQYDRYRELYIRGLMEVATFLEAQGIPC